MPSTYELIADALWPIKLACAIAVGYLIHEWTEKFRYPDDEDPDGFA